MPLESTIICVDNSEFMRNGDYMPNRLQAQQDAVNTVCRSKLLANPENNVGLLTLANTEVLVTLTTDGAKILTSLHRVQPDGFINLLTGIRIAHLSLKHRQSKNHKMRIVVFVGSPVGVDEKEVVKMAKRLKKENVSLDVINFGETDDNKGVLEALVNTLNGREGTGSHLVTVPPPSAHLADALLSSPIVQGEDGATPANFSAGGGFEFGVDPNEDPELALALRVSMEEQRQRQQEEERRTTGGDGAATVTPMEVGDVAAPATVETPAIAEETKEEGLSGDLASAMDQGPTEEEMLQQALAMSLEAGVEDPITEAVETPEIKKKTTSDSFPDFATMTEEEQIAYAMQISMQGCKDDDDEPMAVDPPKKKKKPEEEKSPVVDASETDFSEVMSDAAFLQNVLQSLPGVDTSSQLVQDAVGSMAQEKKDKKKKDKDPENEKDDSNK